MVLFVLIAAMKQRSKAHLNDVQGLFTQCLCAILHEVFGQGVGEMNWDDLRYLLALSREGTLSKAAKRLHVHHTTVSRRIHAFQEERGVRIFEEMPDGFVATEVGEDILDVARRMEEELLSMERRVVGLEERFSGPLRITTVDLLASLYAEALRDFGLRYPKIRYELSVDDQVLDLNRREADVALRMTNKPPEYLIGRKVGCVRFALYASQKLLQTIDPESPLEDFPWIAWLETFSGGGNNRMLKTHAPGAHVAFWVDSPLVMFSLLLSGAGIAFVPCILGDSHGCLRRLRPVDTQMGIDLWLLTHPDLRKNARVRAFMDYMEGVVRKDQAYLEGQASEPMQHRSGVRVLWQYAEPVQTPVWTD